MREQILEILSDGSAHRLHDLTGKIIWLPGHVETESKEQSKRQYLGRALTALEDERKIHWVSGSGWIALPECKNCTRERGLEKETERLRASLKGLLNMIDRIAGEESRK